MGLRSDTNLELGLTERRNGNHVRRGCGVYYSILEHGYWESKQFNLLAIESRRSRPMAC